MPVRVLVAEDEVRLAALLEQALTEAGWTASVVHDGPAALAAGSRGGFDVLLLDWVLPGLEGPEVLRALRADGHATPALLLTARGDLQDRVGGLDAGADDYLAKPFELDELLARLRALHRRARGDRPGRPAGRATCRWTRRAGRCRGATRRLPCRPGSSTSSRCSWPGPGGSSAASRSWTRSWDGDTDLRSNTIDVHVASLRAKIDRPFGRDSIQTVRGVGYRFDPAGG